MLKYVSSSAAEQQSALSLCNIASERGCKVPKTGCDFEITLPQSQAWQQYLVPAGHLGIEIVSSSIHLLHRCTPHVSLCLLLLPKSFLGDIDDRSGSFDSPVSKHH